MPRIKMSEEFERSEFFNLVSDDYALHSRREEGNGVVSYEIAGDFINPNMGDVEIIFGRLGDVAYIREVKQEES